MELSGYEQGCWAEQSLEKRKCYPETVPVPYRDSGPEAGLLVKPHFLAGYLPQRGPTPQPPDSHPTQATIQEEEHLLTGTLKRDIPLGRAFRPVEDTENGTRAH